MSQTDRVVLQTIRIVREITYFVIACPVEVRSLLVRPFGRRGQGMWLRSVTGAAPRVVPVW